MITRWWRMTARATLAVTLVVCLLFSAGTPADAQDRLRPPDRLSPRASLLGFIATVDAVYTAAAENAEAYAASGDLFLSREQRAHQFTAMHRAHHAFEYLDLSEVSRALRDLIGLERVVQLKEILDRITVPPADAIPDDAAIVDMRLKAWRIPDTEIEFVRMEEGPQRGQFLISAATLERLPQFYALVADLPYRPGAGQRLHQAYLSLSGRHGDTIYEALLNSPIGLAAVVPTRWMLALPDWARYRLFGTASWQWMGLGLGLGIAILLMIGARRLAARLRSDQEEGSVIPWHQVPFPLTILFVSGVLISVTCALLRIGGALRVTLIYVEDGVFFVAAAWLAYVGFSILGGIIVTSEHLKRGSLDSQLVLMGSRGIGILAAIVVLIQGADQVGLPAYSVVAGLGVGGLAVALAARDTLANFIGSMLIILEKPFRIGHVIRVGGAEGTVESVGFRSTRIRTPDNSVVSIPSSSVVNATVENLTLRPQRRQRFFVQVTYDTSRATLVKFMDRLRAMLDEHDLVGDRNLQVRLNNFSDSSLDILVMFHLLVETLADELQVREEILLRIMEIAAELEVEFAFPTRTVHVKGAEGPLPG